MTHLWQYIVRAYERRHPETLRIDRKMALFWRLCWWLNDMAIIRVVPDLGGYWRDATWHWAFWRPIVIRSRALPQDYVISWREWRASGRAWRA